MERVYDFNYVELIGILEKPFVFIEKEKSDSIYGSMLLVKRHSNVVDRIPITIKGSLLEKIDKDVLSGKIRIEGHIFCRTVKKKLIISVRVDKKITSKDEATPDKNYVKISGEVCSKVRLHEGKKALSDFLIASKVEHAPKNFIPVIAWESLAYVTSKYVLGNKVHIKGRIQSRTFCKELKDGTVETKEVYELSVHRLRRIFHS